MRLEIRPISVKAARRAVKQWHRHLEDVQGGLFAASLFVDGEMRGVSIAGNPARVWQGQAKLVISRVAAMPIDDDGRGERNACSKLYGAMCRVAQALGYREAWTYTLPEEPGTSLIAAGFEDMGLSAGGEHDRPSRPRKAAKRPCPKRRWRRVLIKDDAFTARELELVAAASKLIRELGKWWESKQIARSRPWRVLALPLEVSHG